MSNANAAIELPDTAFGPPPVAPAVAASDTPANVVTMPAPVLRPALPEDLDRIDDLRQSLVAKSERLVSLIEDAHDGYQTHRRRLEAYTDQHERVLVALKALG